MSNVHTDTSNSLSNRKRVMNVEDIQHAWYVNLGKCGALPYFVTMYLMRP